MFNLIFFVKWLLIMTGKKHVFGAPWVNQGCLSASKVFGVKFGGSFFVHPFVIITVELLWRIVVSFAINAFDLAPLSSDFWRFHFLACIQFVSHLLQGCQPI